jgi:GNAT superfamily N-acetyltransferase
MGMLLTSAITLANGTRVRLRLAQAGDRDLGLGELLVFDPRRRTVVIATAWLGGRETVVGAGAVDRVHGAEPEVHCADELRAPGIGALLVEALREWAQPARDWAA